MRLSLCLAALAASLFAGSATAETRVFIIASNADGYGVDRCLTSGSSCGNTVATAYCQSQSFAQARSFRKIERDEITGAIPASTGRTGDEFVAIECAR